MIKLFQKSLFYFRFLIVKRRIAYFRNLWYSIFGMKIGMETYLPKIYVTWPHKVSIGANCNLEHGIYFKFDGIWEKGNSIQIGDRVFIGSNCEFNITNNIRIGNDCLIASGCRFIDHDHGKKIEVLMRVQEGPAKQISVADNVWLGCNVVVLKGVTIGYGAIVAAGSVVTRDVPQYEIWGGVPAKKIATRQ